jgi:hypothetical protein
MDAASLNPFCRAIPQKRRDREDSEKQTLNRRDRRGRRDAQEKQRQGLDFRGKKIVASREDFHD